MPRLVIVAVAVVSACSDPEPVELACDGRIRTLGSEAGLHVPIGTQIQWSTNPPATGMHYPVWAKWDHHYTSLDRGFWVHNAEHGGVILLYRCDEACPDVVAALLDVARTFEIDDTCQAPVRNRLIVAADPLLPPDVQVAVVGWDALYTASCFDPYVATFAAQRYRRGPEDLCLDGVSLGGTFIAP